MDTFLSALFFLPYASGFVAAILPSLRPGPIAVTVLIVVMVTALPLAIINTSSSRNSHLEFMLVLFILLLVYAGMLVGIVTRLALWFFFSSSTSRSHKWRRSAIMLTSLMFLPGLLLVFI